MKIGQNGQNFAAMVRTVKETREEIFDEESFDLVIRLL